MSRKNEPRAVRKLVDPVTGRDRDPSLPLNSAELRHANDAACKLYTPAGGWVLREPHDNVIGPFRILQRTDELYVVIAPHLYAKEPVFYTLDGARTWAKRESEKDLPKR
jgi:hypothetical protein